MNKAKRPAKPDQYRSFVEKAREIGCEEDKDDEIMRRLAAQPKTDRKPLKTKKAAK